MSYDRPPISKQLYLKLRDHLIAAPDTRRAYLHIIETFWNLSPDVRIYRPTCPEDRDILNFFRDNFPEMRSIPNRSQGILWGMVVKHPKEPNSQPGQRGNNVIFFNKSLCSAVDDVDNDPKQFTVPPAGLYAIFIVVALHELSHALTKFLFGETAITPLGLGMDPNQNVGESGQVLEQNIMGGVLLGEWEEAHRGDVRKMLRLILAEAPPAPWARAWDLGSAEGILELGEFCKSLQSDQMHVIDTTRLLLANEIPLGYVRERAYPKATQRGSFVALSMTMGDRIIIEDEDDYFA